MVGKRLGTLALALAFMAALLVGWSPERASAAYCESGHPSVLAYGNWECRTPEEWSPWTLGVFAKDYSFRLETDLVRQGDYSARFEVRPGDDPSGTGNSERSEVASLGPASRMGEGQAAYYAFSLRHTIQWPQVSGGCCIVAQWRMAGESGLPPLMLNTPYGPVGGANDSLRLLQRAGNCVSGSRETCSHAVNHMLLSGQDFRNSLGTWQDWIVYVDWSINDGHVKVWHRGQGQSDFTNRLEVDDVPTLKRLDGVQDEVYPKTGIYRPTPQNVTHVLYHDSYCIAENYSAALTCFG